MPSDGSRAGAGRTSPLPDWPGDERRAPDEIVASPGRCARTRCRAKLYDESVRTCGPSRSVPALQHPSCTALVSRPPASGRDTETRSPPARPARRGGVGGACMKRSGFGYRATVGRSSSAWPRPASGFPFFRADLSSVDASRGAGTTLLAVRTAFNLLGPFD